MAVCARGVQQQDGTVLLALDPGASNLSACQYVVESGGNSAWRELGALTVNQAHELGLAVGLFLAIAWGFNLLAKAIPSSPERE